MAAQSSTVEDPDFISFLFSSKLKHDCFFLVGNENQQKPERIGVVKAMLMAHSEVLRLELEDSPIASKEEVALPDTSPHTFRILLRYVYGHDTTPALSFDDADNLLYVADKYMMGSLKKKIATRLMPLLNTENICSLLNNPACYTELELKSSITEILRYETDGVLASPLFLNLSSVGFIKILEQDGLNVPEIELWRALMKWAKHNGNTEDGKDLRNQISSLTEHIRICTLDGGTFCQEVVTTGILKDDEVALVCMSIGKQEKQRELTSLCNEVEPRVLLQKREKETKCQLYIGDTVALRISCSQEVDFTIVTNSCDIELLSLQCFKGRQYVAGCTITITNITAPQNALWPKNQVTVRFNECDGAKYIPLTSDGRNVTLLAHNTYSFRMVIDGVVCLNDSINRIHGNSHLTLCLTTIRDPLSSEKLYVVPMGSLYYNTIDT